MYDIIIIGGGPIGLYTAKLCEGLGYRVLIIEEHEEIGKPLRCSGLISSNLEKFIEIKRDFIDHEVSFAFVHSPLTSLKLGPRKAYVVNRCAFDKYMGEVTSKILLNTRAEGIQIFKDGVKIKTNRGLFESEMLIGCDGANSRVARNFGMRPKEMINGLIAIRKEENFSDHVDLYFDKTLIRDGFFWRIPRGKRTEYGVMGKGVNFRYIENFFKIKNYERFTGIIPIGPVQKSYFERVLLIGNSAGQTKPWSGGGIIYGLTCSKIASKVVERAFEVNDFSESFLKEYEIEWRRKIGKQISFGMYFRRILKGINNFEMEFIFKILKMISLNWLDMDFLFTRNF
jgi:geranylgeranyl reductase family protein